MPAKKKAANALQALEDQLKAEGLDYDVLEYSNAYIDILWKDDLGVRHKREFRPDGSEIERDEYGREK